MKLLNRSYDVARHIRRRRERELQTWALLDAGKAPKPGERRSGQLRWDPVRFGAAVRPPRHLSGAYLFSEPRWDT